MPGTQNAPNAGYVYFANEFEDNVGQISPSNIITNYAGIQGSVSTKIQRGTAGTFAIGSTFGVAADVYGNVYATDASSGLIWRVDQVAKSMYVVAGGATTVCAGATNANGDGCPATQAKFGSSATSSGFAGTTPPAPGIFGVSVDAYQNLFVGDTITNLIRKISSGLQFGTVNGSKPVQSIEIHFAAGDMPASNAFTLTAGASNFTILNSSNCTSNSDTTEDCVLTVQANPTTAGPFTGTLKVVSTKGLTSNFTLTGNYVPVATASVATVSVSTGGSNCNGNNVSNTSPATVTTAITSKNGSGTPTGTVTFYANGSQIGTVQTLNSSGSASITYTFTTGTYSVTSVYSGDAFFNPSTSAAQSVVSTSPTFNAVTGPQLSTVAAGQSALYTITLNEALFSGTISFSCSGLPAGTACVFSPQTLTGTGCSGTQTEALTITTTQPMTTSSMAPGGFGPWAFLGLPGAMLALLITLRRRSSPSWMSGSLGRVWLALALLITLSGAIACSNSQTITGTPAGTSTVTLTMTGGGVTTTMPLTLTVH